MGDHRASIKIEMTCGGKTYKADMWINYWPDENGVDNCVTQFFRRAWDDVLARYEEQEFERTREARERDLRELDRLKAKYETRGGTPLPTRKQVAQAWVDAYRQNEHEWACYQIDQSFALNLNRAPEVAQPREPHAALAAADAVLRLFAAPSAREEET